MRLRPLSVTFLAFVLVASLRAANTPAAPWVPDQGDGTYRNPVLFADYSDPDAVRVGDDYYLIASSFMHSPGLPILHSKDLVNWSLINYALRAQIPVDHFAKPRHGQGVWAPAIRYHDGKFWIFYPDPDFGLYVITAKSPTDKWSDPVLVKAGKGLIDPCPFWDDDGTMYLLHGWARSRAGIANQLSLHRLSPDGTRLLDAGEKTLTVNNGVLDIGDVIIDANQLKGWTTLEGPKLYKRDGWYYVFAPAGGVKEGYQAVFRSKNLRGPYDWRIVLDQGKTPINGPHQGAWVDTASGEDWFLHFQDRGPYGRVVHLQPMVWKEGWPVMGVDTDGDGKGEPVLSHRKPNVKASAAIAVPATSDEFSTRELGKQWQWNANPQPDWSSLSARRGFLRLNCQPAPTTRIDGSPAPNSWYDAPQFLTQKFAGPAFTATTRIELRADRPGDIAGLTVFGYTYAVLGVRQTGALAQVVLIVNADAQKPGAQQREVATAEIPPGPIHLRVAVDEKAQCQFSWSIDNRKFTAIGEPVQATVDRWIGATFGLIAVSSPDVASTGYADFDWFRVTAPTP